MYVWGDCLFVFVGWGFLNSSFSVAVGYHQTGERLVHSYLLELVFFLCWLTVKISSSYSEQFKTGTILLRSKSCKIRELYVGKP